MSGLFTQEDLEQRESIFHTGYTMVWKACSIIIDEGSCAIVKELKLSIIPYLSPYTIQWLNQGKGMYISSWCLILLASGECDKDDIWCDACMDACHALLERPSLFDRTIMHDDSMSTYTSTKDNKRITPRSAQIRPHKISLKKSRKWMSFL